MWWDLKPTEKFSKLSFTLRSLPLLEAGFRERGLGSPCDDYLSGVGMRLRRERHTEFAVLNARQLEHGDHCVCVDVEMNIGTN
jgi:hypothetical protein